MVTGWELVLVSFAALALIAGTDGAGTDKTYSVIGGGGTALRDFVSDAVGNATQDANYKGLYLPFYTVGTGVGQQAFLNSTYVYSIGDFPLSLKDYKSAFRPILQIPLSYGPVAIYANVTPEFHKSSTLQLSAPVAAAIFQGNITTWDDPAIVALNPNFTKLDPPIPAGAPIKVVGRTDSNAAAYAMSQWLQQAGNSTWLGGVNKTLPLFPKAKAVSGSGSAVTDYIGKTPGAIGFVDALAGKKAKLADAALLNQAGKFIRYSKGDWTFKGINITTPPSNSDGWASFNITNLPGAATYPVATVSLIFANQDLSEREAKGAAIKAVFGYLLGPSVQGAAKSYEQFPLDPAMLASSVQAVNSIRILDSRDWFQPELYPKLGPPYNVQYKNS
ncbi:g12616 [Coccomyxa viridis]|uniref:G12616 protein n=1 Tax=Coccomyxa viridis TaxID=1274662 RepID=A0ABP1GBT9_9CHLO